MGRPSDNKTIVALVAAVVVLVTAVGVIALLSSAFEYGGDTQRRPTLAFVALAMTAGFAWLVAISLVMRVHVAPWGLVGLVAVGIVMRAMLFVSTPILEDDFYRYLWDGGVAAHGINPYAHVPADVHSGTVAAGNLVALRELAVDSGRVHRRVNHPYLGTIYPPATQFTFAVAHWLAPWSLAAWRFILFICDAATLGILLLLLRQIGQPLSYAAIYWWNPVLLKETYNSAHMDVVALPFILGALWFSLRRRAVWAGIAAGLAIGVKIWPVLLAPILLKALGPRRRARRWAAFGCALALIPMVFYVVPAIRLGGRSGFVAYSNEWEMNDALFMLIHNIVKSAAAAFPAMISDVNVGRLARLLAAGLLAAFVAWLMYPPLRGAHDLPRRCMLVVAALFLLSPAQFPWYYLWLLPFLTLSPQPALLALTVMLPAYYLKFWYEARGEVMFFHNVVVWLEYAPVFVLLAWTWFIGRRRNRKLEPA